MKNLFDITNKVIVLTGGTGVLGACLAEHLAEQSAHVVLLARKEDVAGKLVEKIKNAGGSAAFFKADVLDKSALETARDEILKKYGRVDVLINAAGGNMPGATIPDDKTILDLDPAAMRTVVDLNLMGTVLPTQIFSQPMTTQKAGVIINFSSESAMRPLTRVVGYSAAKAAVTNFTKYMAVELATKFGEGLRVNAIVPGFFLTEQNRALLTNPDGSFTARGGKVIAHTPAGRFGKPEELLGAIQFMCSDASKFMTGTTLVIDGGFDAYSI